LNDAVMSTLSIPVELILNAVGKHRR